MAWGLLRGSWSGLALTALGGVLVWHALGRRGSETLYPETLAFEDETQSEKVGGATDHPGLPHQAGNRKDEPRAEERAAAPAEVRRGGAEVAARRTSWPPEGLTAEEHAEARVRAYCHALTRGGGGLPPYDPAAAAGDFCRAAGEVLAQRLGG